MSKKVTFPDEEKEWIIYMKEGCPFCQMVLDHIKNNNLDNDKKINIFYVDKDFSRDEFKEEYGQDATFPRGYLVIKKKQKQDKDKDKIIFIGGSKEIKDSLG